jgi:hypothetical protein
MAYSSTHLRQAYQMGGKVGGAVWYYDTADATATVDTAGYFSDAKEKGMKKGDEVKVRIWTTATPAATSELLTADDVANDLTAFNTYFVIGINATTGAADLANATIWTVTNTD